MAKILAIIDPDIDKQTALSRCTELPQGTNISLHLAFFVPASGAEKSADSQQAETCKQKDELESMVKTYGLDKYETTTEIIPFERLYESIILTAHECNADYIFKPLRKHSLIRRSLFTSTDWNLIRLCPLPLLLVSQLESIAKKPVVVAVDVCTRDESHSELNRIVLSHAKVVANVLASELHGINAYSFPTTAWGYSSSDPIPYQVAKAKHEDHCTEIRQFADEFGISRDHQVVREGAPALVVNEYAEEVNAGVIVLGTVARSGLAGLFIGNTAESVLENSLTDVMIVKQADFQSPVIHR